MLLCSGACVDDRDGGEFSGHASRPLQGMPNHEHVSILLSHSYSVGEVLSFLDGRSFGLCESECCPTEPCHGRLETQPGTSTRLEEQRCHYSPMKHIGPLLDKRFHHFCHVQHVIDLPSRKVTDRDNVTPSERGASGHGF